MKTARDLSPEVLEQINDNIQHMLIVDHELYPGAAVYVLAYILQEIAKASDALLLGPED